MDTGRSHASMRPHRDAIERKLARLRYVIRSLATLRGGAILLWIVLALIALSFGTDRMFRLSAPGRAVALLVYAGALAWFAWKYLGRPLRVRLPYPVLADIVERRFPDFRDALRSAVDFAGDPAIDAVETAEAPRAIQLSMKREVIREASERAEREDFDTVVDTGRSLAILSGGIAALLLMAVLAVIWSSAFGLWFRRNVLLGSEEWPYRTVLEVEGFSSGNPERGVPRGDSLSLRVRAHGVVPSRVRIRLYYQEETRRFNLAREGDDLFIYEHSEVTEPFEFRVEGGDFRSAPYRVAVLERPEIQTLRVTLEFPPYTAKPEETIDRDLGELAVPEGTRIALEAVATKPLRRAWLETEGEAVELRVSPDDPRHFVGEYEPRIGGMVTIQLEDTESVPPDRWTRFLVTPVPDRAPKVQARLEGIGSMITPRAMIPLRIRTTDDFGVTGLGIDYIAQAEGEEPLQGSMDFPRAEDEESELIWDIQPLEFPTDRRLDLRVFALDNDGIRGPKKGFAPAHSFLVVTEEKLLEDFLRREEEQRQVLERAIEEQTALRDLVYRLIDQDWQAEGELAEDAVKQMVAMAKQERQLSRQMVAISQAMQRILDEMRNNRIAEAAEVERLALSIIGPLAELAEQRLPLASVRIGRIREMTQPADRSREGLELAGEMESILELMERVLQSMKRIEGFTEVVNRLRAIMKIHTESARETQQLYEREIERIFEDVPFEEDDGPKEP